MNSLNSMHQNLKAIPLVAQWQENFKEIQCFDDTAVNGKLQTLLSDHQLVQTILQLFGSSQDDNHIDLASLKHVNSVSDFQSWVQDNLFPIIEKSYQSLSVSGLDNLDPAQAYIFVSNHRDIVMDPLILNKALLSHGFSTSNCAIGDNLLKHSAANDLALLNRCFKVFRSLKSPRAILKAMKTQSEYIRYLHFTQKEHIWIAQKEGRAKDNIDKTNPALIKMFTLAKPKELALSDYLSALKIVPVCFSYEWDPCDTDKAQELIEIAQNSSYSKGNTDDFIAAKKGLSEHKGRIHIAFGDALTVAQDDTPKQVAESIDNNIQNAYYHYPVNYASYKRINGSLDSHEPYSKQEINTAGKLLEERLSNQNEEVHKKVYTAYAQGLNKLKSHD